MIDKIIKSMLCLSAVSLSPSEVMAQISDDDFISGFIAGDYILIGKAPDSDRTYSGRVTIRVTPEGLVIKRTIGSETVTGTATAELTREGVGVLRIRFHENEIDYEETCMIESDLDNYSRFTCYLYQPGVETDQPGLEALFHDFNK